MKAVTGSGAKRSPVPEDCGRYLYCESGSHLAIYDDQKTYFNGLIQFTRDLDAKR